MCYTAFIAVYSPEVIQENVLFQCLVGLIDGLIHVETVVILRGENADCRVPFKLGPEDIKKILKK